LHFSLISKVMEGCEGPIPLYIGGTAGFRLLEKEEQKNLWSDLKTEIEKKINDNANKNAVSENSVS
jgi:hypothetical protein